MDIVKRTELAHALYNTHGDKAELEAAQQENRFRSAGNQDEAERWRSIRGAIRRIKGANQS